MGAPAIATTFTQPVVYDAAVEGVFLRGLVGQITPTLSARLRELGLDLDQKLRPTYPREQWTRFLEVTVAELFPGQTREEGFRLLGEKAVNGIGYTRIGKALVSLAKLMGPRRAMLRLPQVFTSMNNYMRLDLEEMEPSHFRVHINDAYGHPAYAQGALQAAMSLADAKDLQVVILDSAPEISLDVRWAP
ncbi:MAG TPA: DUF2378 family protein [Myxococcales bacterium]|nr:DUF2378 family protein [Myxococcales bacterium]